MSASMSLVAASLLLLSRSWFSLDPVHAFVVDRQLRPSRTRYAAGIGDSRGGGASLRRNRLWGQTPGDAGDPDNPEELDRPHPLRPVPRAKDDLDPPPFATGAALAGLRADLDSLRENLRWAQAVEDADLVRDLTTAIAEGERLDPDLAYAAALRAIDDARASGRGRSEAVHIWQRRAQRARAALPQFQLEGLWVGNYGEPGDQLINITYIGDTIIASKATGDDSVPRGEVSFTVDLSPVTPDRKPLEPLRLALDRADGATVRLPRFAGRGQLAKPGFTEPTYVEGQLVLFERHLSFVWLPLRHHVLFRRPTPQEVLTLLRDALAAEDELGNMRHHLESCFALDPAAASSRPPPAAEDGTDGDASASTTAGAPSFRRISLQQELDALAATTDADRGGGFRFPLWNLKKYWDSVLRDMSHSRPPDDSEEPRSFYEGEGI